MNGRAPAAEGCKQQTDVKKHGKDYYTMITNEPNRENTKDF